MFPHASWVRVLVIILLTLFAGGGIAQLARAATQQDSITPTFPQSISNSIARITVGSNSDSDSALLVYLGLSDKINDSIVATLSEQLTGMSVEFAQSTAPSSKAQIDPDITAVIGAGTSGCESAIGYSANVPVVCILLTKEKFVQIQSDVEPRLQRNLMAIVIDQPVSRQAVVASRVYPALLRYTTLTQKSDAELSAQQSVQLSDVISTNRYREDQALAVQLTESLNSHDALIATVETDIFNRDTLRTVLLTAYGYGKPVIGLSRAYVKAGALITAYSTPEQIVRQLAELLLHPGDDIREGVSDTANATPPDTSIEAESVVPLPMSVLYPRYFSVIDNISVAKSLGLNKALNFSVDDTYVDGDFLR